MFQRQKTGSVVCPSCGKLVGIKDEKCWNCGRLRPGMWGWAPLLRRLGQDLGFVEITIGACALLYALTLFASAGNIRFGGIFGFLAPSVESLVAFGASGPFPVLGHGRWWTVLSAGWLHGGLLHIAFNLYWVYQFAPAVAELYGTGRMVILYTLGSVAGFLLSSLSFFAVQLFPPVEWIMGGGGGITVGASAALFGLLGAMVWYGRRGPGEVGRQALIYAVIFFAFGLILGSIDNWAHLGGFLGGYFGGRVLDPMKPERGDHLIAALLCLVASVAAVGASLLIPL